MEGFRDARIHVESRSAALIDEGLSGRFLHDTGAEWGLDFPFEPHYDEVFEVGAELSLGPFRIATLDAAGHMLDGAAYVLIDEGILVPGDNLCSLGAPLVFWSVSAAAETVERLLGALEPLRRVVGGSRARPCAQPRRGARDRPAGSRVPADARVDGVGGA